MNKTLAILNRLKKIPLGYWLFSRVVCLKAPYFASIRPLFLSLEPGHGSARLKKRRSIQNHLGTVHAIAMANLCELVAGLTLEVSLPATHRWIPKGMTIQYLQKANTDVCAHTVIPLGHWPEAGSFLVRVEVVDAAQTVVVRADIEMYISRKPIVDLSRA